MNAIVCPIDNKDDVIQRVSAVVSGGISSGNFLAPSIDTPGYTNISGVATSNLAQMLDLPSNAKKKSGVVWWMYIALFYGFALIIVSIYAVDENPLIPFFIGVGLISLVYFSKKKREEEHTKPNWVAYKSQWDKLYYCHRHGIVFDQETGLSCEPSQINNFINKLIESKIPNADSLQK